MGSLPPSRNVFFLLGRSVFSLVVCLALTAGAAVAAAVDVDVDVDAPFAAIFACVCERFGRVCR